MLTLQNLGGPASLLYQHQDWVNPQHAVFTVQVYLLIHLWI